MPPIQETHLRSPWHAAPLYVADDVALFLSFFKSTCIIDVMVHGRRTLKLASLNLLN